MCVAGGEGEDDASHMHMTVAEDADDTRHSDDEYDNSQRYDQVKT